MSIAIKLDDQLVELARAHAQVACRSTPRQIEYWAMVGRIAEQNPDLSFEMINGLLQARAELKAGEVSDYTFG